MILDGHVHLGVSRGDPRTFMQRLRAAGMAGGVLISLPPKTFWGAARSASPASRIRGVLSWCAAGPRLYPFFWIDPLERNALRQVALAVAAGIRGFKIICDRFPPGDRRAMRVYRAIAANGRPILFHSGILWDGKPSSEYNRPVGFEPLLEVPGLRFCLAHVGWPWCDELIAVYGKFQNAATVRSDLAVEMFIDLTPGTPRLYREEVLTKLYGVGYDVEDHVIFGSDGTANDYGVRWVRQWLRTDRAILRRLGLSAAARHKVHSGNLMRFVGVTAKRAGKQPLQPGA